MSKTALRPRPPCFRKSVSMKANPQLEIEPSLEPWLKDFLDRVIIPALLREFTNSLVDSSDDVGAHSLEETPKGEFE